jgi:hypothetical protein
VLVWSCLLNAWVGCFGPNYTDQTPLVFEPQKPAIFIFKVFRQTASAMGNTAV